MGTFSESGKDKDNPVFRPFVRPYIRPSTFAVTLASTLRYKYVTLKSYEILRQSWYKYKTPSDNVDRTSAITSPTLFTELCPFENFSKQTASSQ